MNIQLKQVENDLIEGIKSIHSTTGFYKINSSVSFPLKIHTTTLEDMTGESSQDY